MKPQPHSRRLSPLDATFLYFEREELPLHMGSVSEFEGPIPFERLVAAVDSKLQLVPRYRQIVMWPPFHLGHPTWEFDPDFDIRRHIFRVTVDPPGGAAELQALTGRIFSPLMDRSKPLWDLYLVEGLQGGRSAVIARLHHSMADGISGSNIMSILMDTSAEGPPPLKKVRYRPPPLPRAEDLLAAGLESTVFDSLQRLIDAQKGAFELAQALLSGNALPAFEKLLDLLPELATPPERLPFNRPCSGERKFVWTEWPMAEVKAIRTALGGTYNDVVLTAVTGAVSRYARLHRETVANRLVRYMVPVNLRREEERGNLGNRLSMLPLSLPLDVSDPARRLQAVRLRMEAMKSARIADLIALTASWFAAAPAPFEAVLAALPFLSPPAPIINMVCTNVPGPPGPLYMAGQRMLTYYPSVPTGWEVGLGCAVQSYDEKFYFGLTADAKVMPDVDRMREFLDRSFAELRKAAGLSKPPRKRPTPAATPEPPPLAMTATSGN